MLFLETAFSLEEVLLASGMSAAFVGAIIGAIIFLTILVLALYVYTSIAYMAIARKAKQDMPGIAWVPLVGPTIIAFKSSNMHWWPWLLLIGYIMPIVGFIAVLAFWVFAIIWHWKLFEKVNKPGWWSILLILPLVNLVIIGIVAWSKK